MMSTPSSIILSYIMLLLAMAFFTLFEQKILGYMQLRKGPNKVSLWGVPQPLADALKLFSKEMSWPMLSNKMLFMWSPFITLILALLMWLLLPSSYPMFSMKYGLLYFLCISSLSVYTILAAGWASNSKYSLLGSIRSIAQTISYEVSMSILMLSPLMILMTFNTQKILYLSYNTMYLMPMVFLTWFTTMLAETNRSPFDLAEGESELVSGFNTEYSGGLFTIIFMAEYLNIMFVSLITSLMFLSTTYMMEFKLIFLSLETTALAYLFIWTRATLPRMRYDFLMNFTWKSILPLALISLLVPLTINP